MIQRKGELILSWIGNGLHLLYVFLIGIFFIMTQTSDFKNGMIQGFIEENPGEYDLAYQTYNIMLGLGVVLIIILLILLIVSIVAAILIGKNAKVSGILLCYYRNHWSLFKFYGWCLMVNSRYHAFSNVNHKHKMTKSILNTVMTYIHMLCQKKRNVNNNNII